VSAVAGATPAVVSDFGSAIVAAAWQALETVMDPELPLLSIVDLGMIRLVEMPSADSIRISVCPTYSGCPAYRVIRERIREVILKSGVQHVEVREVLTPPWTSDWITERGRAILRESGIAPPIGRFGSNLGNSEHIPCPHCGSVRTERISEFGSTACKAQHRCLECLEPFEYFKCI
jgi:ring-1,2-phenylacetyl-CoA epoxidase subunit PaaD